MKLSELKEYLLNLDGEIRVSDIVKNIRSCYDNEKHFDYYKDKKSPYESDTLQLPVAKHPTTNEKINLNDIWIDMSYQRKLKMTKILEHLKSFLEKKTKSTCPFDTMLAGTLDLSVRKSGRVYAWDGFRRIMLALLSGIEYMPATITNLTEINNAESRKIEAYAFKKKNGDSEVMKPEELFKSGCVWEDPDSLTIRAALINCDLDVLKVNPNNKTLGAFTSFKDDVLKNKIGMSYLVDASNIIQKSWPNDCTVTGYLLSGLARYLVLNDEDSEIFGPDDSGYEHFPEGMRMDNEEITKCFEEFIKANKTTQKQLCKPAVKGRAADSVAYQLGTKVFGKKEWASKIADSLNFDEGLNDLLHAMSNNKTVPPLPADTGPGR